ncbi:MAG: hypothetical protein HY344_00595 [Candidatus Levybacteria bacterium]|nr:hypothetical protein [Candidatus Levybacteria bacterium]
MSRKLEARENAKKGIRDQDPRVEVPRFIPPMLVGELGTRNLSLLDRQKRFYEVKADGYRTIVTIRHGEDGPIVRLLSKNGKDITQRFPLVTTQLADIKDEVVLDGEMEALRPRPDALGITTQEENALFEMYGGLVPDRNLLSLSAIHLRHVDYRLRLFDILFLNGRHLTTKPLSERKLYLNEVVPDELSAVSTVPYFEYTSDAALLRLLKAVDKFGLEGMVAKRTDSVYTPGRRSDRWLKIKRTPQQPIH